MEVDDIVSYHDVVTEKCGAVAAATWFRLLAETNFEFPFDLARIVSRPRHAAAFSEGGYDAWGDDDIFS